MIRRVLDWLQDRTGLNEGVKHFLNEPIPRSVGWRNTLGSAAGALILVQTLTGFLLALYYVPHPEAAYESIEHLEKNLTAGAFIRALHYWGASFIIAALFLHMVRVFYAGAYKKPRELTWMLGVVIFCLVMALAGSGQLLPWNQAGYWAAKVGVELASSAPIAGPYLRDIMLGGTTLGAITLTRFYAAHAMLFPALLAILIMGHLYLLRRHGALRPAADSTSHTQTFFPYQVVRDLVSVSFVIGALAIVALTVGGPDSPPADPSDSTYSPHPEWYFLSHFELLRFTPGAFKDVTTFYMPTVVLLILLALPWLDRGDSLALRSRPLITALGTFAIVTVITLTTYGVLTEPERRERVQEVQSVAALGAYDSVAEGRRVYMTSKCQKCHRINRRGGHIGPDLTGVGARLQEDYLRAWLLDPSAFDPETQMPPTNVTEQQMDELMAFLRSLVGDNNP